MDTKNKPNDEKQQPAVFAPAITAALSLVSDEAGRSNLEAIVDALYEQAKKGNLKAFEIIREAIGEKPAADPPAAEIKIIMGDAEKYAV